MCMAVINGKVAVEVDSTYPGAFYHYGAWYVWERDWKWN